MSPGYRHQTKPESEKEDIALQAVLQHVDEHRKAQLEELFELLRIPSIGAQPQHNADTKAAADWLIDNMRRAGLENVRIIPTAGHPAVYGDWLHVGQQAPTVLIYGHYDVQPPEPLELWETPPFEPDIREGYIYGRGSSDDKGQLHIHIKVVEAYLKSTGSLPLNVKFILEGEEESGSPNLNAVIRDNKKLLAADIVLISDTSIPGPEQPAIVYGLRGICSVLMDVTGPARDLHSGSYGGGIDNPLNALCHIIAKLKDESGHILVPGFYDKVRPLSSEERELLGKSPLSEADWLKETGAHRAWGEPEYSLVERLGARPTLDLNGIIGGYTGPGTKTVLPSAVHAKLSMRLVPDQDPKEIGELFRKYIATITPPSIKVNLTIREGAPASIIDYTIPPVKAAAAAYTKVFGRKPVYTREGGSIPIVNQFKSQLGLETILMGFGLPSDRAHSPNERFYLQNYYRGIKTGIHFLAKYAELASQRTS
jgi:acetylornithine deacetylase/succinyl-diaminopimelate desuccinylase-like protein